MSLNHSEKFNSLFAKAQNFPAIKTAVICPDNKESLEGVVLAASQKSIIPIIIGELAKINKIAAELNLDISKFEGIDLSSHDAVALGVKMAREGMVQAIVKGNVHTDYLMAEVVNRDRGLRIGKRMSHCVVTDVPMYNKLLLLSDAGLNTLQTIKEKQSIVQNAIDLAIAIGIAKPKVALLSATEVVSSNIPSTMECVELCKMTKNGEIVGGIVDGPLSFDLAISQQSVNAKGIKSEVAGDADILIVPNIETGNVLLKCFDYFCNAISLDIVVGAKVPLVVTSRASSAVSRAGSCMLAKFICIM